MADPLDDLLARAEAAVAARQNRGFLHTLGDNLIGYDDGVNSFGENLATALNIGGESMTAGVVGDEAAAGFDAMIGRGPYDDRLVARRTQEAEFRADHPIATLGAEVGGALVPAGLGAGFALQGANRLTQGIRGLLAGGAAGGTQGFMEGGEDGNDRLSNVTLPALIGGGIGAVAPAVGGAAQALYRRFGPGAAAALRRTEREIGTRGAATDLVSDAVERDAPFAGRAMSEAGQGAINAEMGPNVAGLLDYVVNRPGGSSSAARAALENLGERRSTAFTGTLNEALGGAPQGVARTQKDIMQSTAAARREAYAVPYSTPIDYTSEAGQRLQGILRRVPSSVREQAMTLGRAAGTVGQEVATDVDDMGRAVNEVLPDVAQVDAILRALSDVSKPTLGVGSNAAGTYRDLARELRSTIDELVPSFAAARAQGADAIANREAVEFGRDLLADRVTMDVAEDALAAMGPAEKQFAAQGLRSQIDEVMANAERALTDGNMDIRETMRTIRDLTTRSAEVKLAALLGPAQSERLIQSAKEMYSALSLRARVSRNSATQPRQAWDEIINRATPVSPMEALQEGQGVGGAAAAAIRPLAGDPAAGRMARQDDLLDMVARTLMSPVRSPNSPVPVLPQLPGLLGAARDVGQRVGNVTTEMGGLLGLLAAQRAAQTGPR